MEGPNAGLQGVTPRRDGETFNLTDMIAETKKTMEIVIKLTAKEAAWLKGLVQNPAGNPYDESAEHRGMREGLFDCLPSFQQLSGINSDEA